MRQDGRVVGLLLIVALATACTGAKGTATPASSTPVGTAPVAAGERAAFAVTTPRGWTYRVDLRVPVSFRFHNVVTTSPPGRAKVVGELDGVPTGRVTGDGEAREPAASATIAFVFHIGAEFSSAANAPRATDNEALNCHLGRSAARDGIPSGFECRPQTFETDALEHLSPPVKDTLGEWGEPLAAELVGQLNAEKPVVWITVAGCNAFVEPDGAVTTGSSGACRLRVD